MYLGCAAGILCGCLDKDGNHEPLPSSPQHHCMYCGQAMHGGTCGSLYDEIVGNESFLPPFQYLNDRAKALVDSRGAIMCNLCIETNLRRVNSPNVTAAAPNEAFDNTTDGHIVEISSNSNTTTSTQLNIDGEQNDVSPSSLPPPVQMFPQPASLPEQRVPSYDRKTVAKLFQKAFPIGKWYDSSEHLYDELVKFANMYHFTVRKQNERCFKCSRASNTNYKKKQSNEKTVEIQEFSVASGCPMELRFSLRKRDQGKVQISFVNGEHNHDLDVPCATISQRLSGRDIESILPTLAPQLRPHLRNGKQCDFKIARAIISEVVGPQVRIKYESIRSIVTACQKYINDGNCPENGPLINTEAMLTRFQTYVTADCATENCDDVLKSVSLVSSDMSWSTHKLLEGLKNKDPAEFDYRQHMDSAGNIDAFTWQTGVQRAAFLLYGDCIFLDARKNENMNELGMRYMTLLVIDANNRIWPISHTFAFEEELDLYQFACEATLEMTPGRTKESIRLGYGDMFFDTQRVREWFPNITMMIDAYHLIYAKSGRSILAKEFGPTWWEVLRRHFIKAMEANTKEKFNREIDNALQEAGTNQSIRDKIVKWQKLGHLWGHFARDEVLGHRDVSTSSYAESNHASLTAMAPDDPHRTMAENTVDIMKRDRELIEERQEKKHLWAAAKATHIDEMSAERASHLSTAREILDEKPYAFFVKEYDHSAQYNVRDEERDHYLFYFLDCTILSK